MAKATYGSLKSEFRWRVPSELNLGVACSDAHPADGVGLVAVDEGGRACQYTFGEMADLSSRLAGGLAAMGVGKGDRVGVVVPQSVETGLSLLAIWKLGAVAVPLASLFGPDALSFRLTDSEAKVVVVSPENTEKVSEAAPGLPIVTSDEHLHALCRSDPVVPVSSDAEDPAFLIYTSGTTGPPKGALHAHRSLIGHLPGFELYYEFAQAPPNGRYDLSVIPHLDVDDSIREADLIWTPADWAWIGGMMDVLVPAWYFGMPVLTAKGDFDPAGAVELMASQAVTLAFLPPTALKMMRAAGVDRSDLSLRAIFTGGESLGEEMLHWGRESLDCEINEGYGQTEANLVVGNCASVWPVRPGSMGRALPGHDVVVQDPSGHRLIGEVGEICVRSPDPVLMLGYFKRPEATEEKYRNGWLLTGDLGMEDEDGYLWFSSRKDDVISSMGYRIGPGEIEESLMGHPAVGMCAVAGIPDEVRGQVPAAFIVLREGFEASEHLVTDLQDHVRTRLAAHEVPRRIYFLGELPRTTTGKIMRRSLRELVHDLDPGINPG